MKGVIIKKLGSFFVYRKLSFYYFINTGFDIITLYLLLYIYYVFFRLKKIRTEIFMLIRLRGCKKGLLVE